MFLIMCFVLSLMFSAILERSKCLPLIFENNVDLKMKFSLQNIYSVIYPTFLQQKNLELCDEVYLPICYLLASESVVITSIALFYYNIKLGQLAPRPLRRVFLFVRDPRVIDYNK